MKKTEFSYVSANGSTAIHAVMWAPETAPKAVLQIAHGITEYIERHEDTARYFTQRGYVVVGNDHLGHGASVDGDRAQPMYFGPAGSWRFVVEDIKTCMKLTQEKYPQLPCCLMGFSLGSFAVRCLLGQDSALADMTIWVGTGRIAAANRLIAQGVARMEERRFGDGVDTPLLHRMTMGIYNRHFKPHRTEADWICADPEAAQAYLNDPLCGKGFTVSSFREMIGGMKTCNQDACMQRLRKDMPVLLISGSDDPVGGFGRGVDKVCAQLKKNGMTDVEMRLFEGMRHDVFHGEKRDEVMRCIEAWMDKRLPRMASGRA